LIAKKQNWIERRVPLLSQIPLLGNLFRYEARSTERRELLIILTPHVIRSPEDAERVKQAEARRISWTAADVYHLHGPTGIFSIDECPDCAEDVPVIYPDLDPRALKLFKKPRKQIRPEPLKEVPVSSVRRVLRTAYDRPVTRLPHQQDDRTPTMQNPLGRNVE